MNAAVDLTPTVTSFHEHAVWTGATDKDRSTWLAMRRTMVTASDMAAILGEDDYRCAYDVYVDKILPPRPEVRAMNPMFWGKVLEQTILSNVAEFYGWKYRGGGYLLRSRQYPHMGATLDAEVDRGLGHGWEPFEGKTSRITRDWDEEAGELPRRVVIQVQHHLLVTGQQSALVFALLQGSINCLVPIEASPEFHRVLVLEAERFMERVQEHDPPPPGPMSKLSVERLFPRGDGSAIVLPKEAVDWTRQLHAISQQEKELAARRSELRNMLRNCIGDATFGVLPEEVNGKAIWRYQDQHTEGYTVPARDGRVLIALKDPAKKRKPQRFPADAVRITIAPPTSSANDGRGLVLERESGLLLPHTEGLALPPTESESPGVTRFRTKRRRSPR